MSVDGIQPRRVMVYGVTGSGKTTMAQRIGERLGLPAIRIDELTWQPNWVAVPEEQQRSIIESVCSQQRWVIDHAYSIWFDIPLARVELIVGLDYPRLLSLGRLIWRCVTNLVTRRGICNGNVETLRHLFHRDSIVVWHFRSFTRKRARMRSWTTDPTMPPVMLFRRPQHAVAWLNSLPQAENGTTQTDSQ